MEGTSGAVKRSRFREGLRKTALQGLSTLFEALQARHVDPPIRFARSREGPMSARSPFVLVFQITNGVNRRQEVSGPIRLG